MKNKKQLFTLIGAVILVLLGYYIIVFIVLQQNLIPQLKETPQTLESLGNSTIFALFLVVVFHIIFLIRYLKTTRNHLASYLFAVFLIILSVIFLIDYALLSDIGKEYVYRSVDTQFAILYGLTAFQITVIVLAIIQTVTPDKPMNLK